MKKLLLLTLAAIALPVAAATLTPGQALARLQGAGQAAPALRVAADAAPVHTALTSAGAPAVYVFDRPGGGYMLLAADDAAYPLLGYTDSGTFDPSHIPPAMQWWLGQYAGQIAAASARGVATAEARPAAADRAAIQPMIKTGWDQDTPYNDMCPKSGGRRTYTGCVATAMAQVMNYWQYPAKGQGKISYTSSTLQKRLELDFSQLTFGWTDMLPTYTAGSYTQQQADAVATLMKAAGYAVKMNYGTDSSGALAMNIANGLIKYFNYDPNTHYTMRVLYSASQWEQMIYDNLRDVGPVIYGGSSMIGGGHSFIVDGYDGNGFFHFNWGWSYMSDGYFVLDALNPEQLGSGGSTGGGYNFTQDAVLGIRPPTGQPAEDRPLQITQMGALAGQVNGSMLTFDLVGQESAMWVNYNPQTLVPEFGVFVAPADKPDSPAAVANVSNRLLTLQPGYGAPVSGLRPALDLATLNLADGKYRLTMATRITEVEGAEWQPVLAPYGYSNYVIVTKDGDYYEVSSVPVATMTIKDAGFDTDLYYGAMTTVTLDVANESDIELSRGFAPVLMIDGVQYFLGESIMVTLAPGEQKSFSWTTSLFLLQQYYEVTEDTEFTLTFFDESTYNYDTENFRTVVTMHPNPGAPRLNCTTPTVTNARIEAGVLDGKNTMYYFTSTPEDIQVSTTVELRSGLMAYPLYACISEMSQEYEGMLAVLNVGGHPVFMSERGEKLKFNTSVSYPGMVLDRRYYLSFVYEFGGQLVPVNDKYTFIFLEGSSAGVDDVAVDAPAEAEYYDLRGVRVRGELSPGIYLRRTPAGTEKVIIR